MEEVERKLHAWQCYPNESWNNGSDNEEVIKSVSGLTYSTDLAYYGPSSWDIITSELSAAPNTLFDDWVLSKFENLSLNKFIWTSNTRWLFTTLDSSMSNTCKYLKLAGISIPNRLANSCIKVFECKSDGCKQVSSCLWFFSINKINNKNPIATDFAKKLKHHIQEKLKAGDLKSVCRI